ncbi:MAG: homocysteine S-methyltransferase family protein [Clostridia bacterium]|nr:homocysteine S-methyltransferase family protein [Clostridia bacterium]
MTLLQRLKQERLYFDGGTGTCLQAKGLQPGEKPETWNLTHPEEIVALHKAYLDAGCHIIKTNTFGINKDRFTNAHELIEAALQNAREARKSYPDTYIAFDMGPTGRMLVPYGDLAFEDCVALYADNVKALTACGGADCILIETMNDALETKAAVLAAKENCDLPIFVTNAYDESGHLMTGADPMAMIAMLEGLQVDAIGMNCSFGPDQMLTLLPHFTQHASVPVIVNPNAGLPKCECGKTCYDLSPEEFAGKMVALATQGATLLGGCCGTTPEYLRLAIEKTKNLPYALPTPKTETVVSSYTHSVTIGRAPVLIGERINPTGKPKLKEALRSHDLNYLLNEGIRQTEAGVQILDVNVGLPEIDEPAMMEDTVKALQAVTNLPLQIDSSSPEALERAMRTYAGKPMINSVNGKISSMESILPLVAKYGGVLVALTLDENGIPDTVEGRVEIAKRIIAKAKEYGIAPKDIVVDPLTLTVSSDSNSGNVTLGAVQALTNLGIHTVLGVSNISFGLPRRDLINPVFFAQALQAGLSAAIMNPFSQGMMDVYYGHNALHGWDNACSHYIAYAQNSEAAAPQNTATDNGTLKEAIVRGLTEVAATRAGVTLQSQAPLEIIETQIIPALNEIGAGFEAKTVYLPQLLQTAEAAAKAFDVLKEKMTATDTTDNKVILATVKGDIHDIGKNIVRVLLESYGFQVIDLGRDVAPDAIVQSALENGCKIVGLSALMTTTVPAMEETIALLHKADPSMRIMVGGAVLTPEYATQIGADFYGRDAMEAVHIVQTFYGG